VLCAPACTDPTKKTAVRVWDNELAGQGRSGRGRGVRGRLPANALGKVQKGDAQEYELLLER